MEQTVSTHCGSCGEQQLHDIYVDSNAYVHSLCTGCGKDVHGATPVDEIAGGMVKLCAREDGDRYHVKYISKTGYIHWLCATCGSDIRSASPVR
jgi:hypothetical protein